MNPKPVSDVHLAFGGNISELLPHWNDIPDEFKHGNNEWCRIVSDWFFGGIPKGTEFTCKDGIDGKLALRHLRAVLCSFEPKHEHKEAGCAFLMSQWFKSVKKP